MSGYLQLYIWLYTKYPLFFSVKMPHGRGHCVFKCNWKALYVEQRQKKWVISAEEVHCFNLASRCRASGQRVGLKGRKASHTKNAKAAAAILPCISRWQHHGANRGETSASAAPLRQPNGRFSDNFPNIIGKVARNLLHLSSTSNRYRSGRFEPKMQRSVYDKNPVLPFLQPL